MLYTKYESSGPCSFRQEDFWKLHFENLLFDPVPYATNQNHLNNFGRAPPRDHSCEVWSNSNELFQRRRCLSKTSLRTTDDARRTTTDDGQRPVTIAHPENFVLRWAKSKELMNVWFGFLYFQMAHSCHPQRSCKMWLFCGGRIKRIKLHVQ